jgi:hypothetical protein
LADRVLRTSEEFCFEREVEALKAWMRQFPDKRTGKNLVYSIEDAALGAFSVFYMQSPSFLAFQTMMQRAQGKSNAQALFGMHQIPTDNHIRSLLDPVAPSYVLPMFERLFNQLDAAGQIDAFRIPNGQLLIALDGTQYHRSESIHCKHCTVSRHHNGENSYAHTALTPVVVTLGHNRVVALEPEFVVPQDGHDKQDCESVAAKRWLAAYGARYRGRQVTLLGDDLYSRQALCEQILALGLNFIFVCKPSSHETLYEWLPDLARSGGLHTHQVLRRQGKKSYTDTYRYAAQVPLRDGDDALAVNWCELITTNAAGERVYHNAFVTAHAIDQSTVAQIVAAGRARWKIENGCNNTLKTKGYHLTHNFGHGKNQLSALLASLNLLAFLLHTVQELVDRKYQALRAHLPSRATFFNHLSALTHYLCFDSLEAMLDFMLHKLEIEFSDSG